MWRASKFVNSIWIVVLFGVLLGRLRDPEPGSLFFGLGQLSCKSTSIENKIGCTINQLECKRQYCARGSHRHLTRKHSSLWNRFVGTVAVQMVHPVDIPTYERGTRWLFLLDLHTTPAWSPILCRLVSTVTLSAPWSQIWSDQVLSSWMASVCLRNMFSKLILCWTVCSTWFSISSERWRVLRRCISICSPTKKLSNFHRLKSSQWKYMDHVAAHLNLSTLSEACHVSTIFYDSLHIQEWRITSRSVLCCWVDLQPEDEPYRTT